jgi:hypothetical protein
MAFSVDRPACGTPTPGKPGANYGFTPLFRPLPDHLAGLQFPHGIANAAFGGVPHEF